MNPALFFGLWTTAFGSLLAGHWFVQHEYGQALKREAQQFERDWEKLETTYDKI